MSNQIVGASPRGCGDLARWLAWQEAAHPTSWDLGLERITTVWRALGAPRVADYIVSIAGTNGKGSCVCWGEALCRVHGIRVASFSSPHLLDYRERIRFDGEMVDADVLCAAFDAIDEARGEISLTYFEWSALSAFYLMAQYRPQVALLEVGLGGRLDAVNMLDADATVFTRIGLDHQDWLGDTVEKIGAEKAGIMRDNQRIAFADAHPPLSLQNAATQHSARLWRYGADLQVLETVHGISLRSPVGEFALPRPTHMVGRHQYGHLAAMVAVLGECFALNVESVKLACQTARNPARLMVTKGNPRHIVDVAHNADSAEVLAGFLADIKQKGERFLIVCGMLKDKDHEAVFRFIDPYADEWFLTSLYGSRGTDSLILRNNALAADVDSDKIMIFDSVRQALQAAESRARQCDTVVVMGSFVTVSEALTFWREND